MKIIKKIFLISILSSNLYSSLLDFATIIGAIIPINNYLIKKLSDFILDTEKLKTMSKEQLRDKLNLFLGLVAVSTCTITVSGMLIILENEADNINRRILFNDINQIANSEKNLNNAENINRHFVSANDDIYRDYHHGLFHSYIIRRNNTIVIVPHARTEDIGDDQEPRQGKKSSKDPYKVITILNQPEHVETIRRATETGSIISKLIKMRKIRIFEGERTYLISNDKRHENQ